MTEHFNKLTPAELERLACLAEECAEVIHAVGKILRHGYEDCNPFEESEVNNRRKLEEELGDLRYSIQSMSLAGDVKEQLIAHWTLARHAKAKRFMHHQLDPTGEAP